MKIRYTNIGKLFSLSSEIEEELNCTDAIPQFLGTLINILADKGILNEADVSELLGQHVEFVNE